MLPDERIDSQHEIEPDGSSAFKRGSASSWERGSSWASDYPELTHYPDNVRILESFAQCGKLTPEQAEALKAAYLEYRARSHRFALAQQPAQVPDTDFIATRTLVQQCWHSLLSPHPNPLP